MRRAVASGACLGLAAAFVLSARRQTGERLRSTANAMTLTRAGAAALLAGEAAVRRRDPVPWLALLWGCTLSDWLDGPLARRRGASRLGAVLDIEADSWLTLWAAVAAWRCGSLPGWSLLAPVLRYPVRLAGQPRRSIGARPWQRAAGTLQMTAFCGALSPSLALRRAARRLAWPAAAAQLAALAPDLLAGR